MKLEHYPARKFKKELMCALGKHLDLKKYKVFVFGSRAKGDASDRSDIDIGIEGPRRIPLHVKSALEEELETIPTLYTIDLVDFKMVSRRFKNYALKWKEPLN